MKKFILTFVFVCGFAILTTYGQQNITKYCVIKGQNTLTSDVIYKRVTVDIGQFSKTSISKEDSILLSKLEPVKECKSEGEIINLMISMKWELVSVQERVGVVTLIFKQPQ